MSRTSTGTTEMDDEGARTSLTSANCDAGAENQTAFTSLAKETHKRSLEDDTPPRSLADDTPPPAKRPRLPMAPKRVPSAPVVAAENVKPLAQTKIREYMAANANGTPTGGILKGFCFSRTPHSTDTFKNSTNKEFMGSFGKKTRGETNLTLVVFRDKSSGDDEVEALYMTNTYGINEFWKRTFDGEGLGKLFPGFVFAKDAPPDPLSADFDDYPFLESKSWICLPGAVGKCPLFKRATDVISWFSTQKAGWLLNVYKVRPTEAEGRKFRAALAGSEVEMELKRPNVTE